jgi:TusA-related sulfurtransferase
MKISVHKAPPTSQRQRKAPPSKYAEAHQALANLPAGEWLKIEFDNETELRRVSQSLRGSAKKERIGIRIVKPDRAKTELWVTKTAH